ncbi:MAG: hypothetical protein QM778_18090 [Myxococcales bacterium]
MASVRVGLALFALGLPGCDTLVDQSYRGVPLDTVRTTVANETGVPLRHPRAAAFWAHGLQDGAEDLVEQVSTSQPARDGANYTLNLFEEPSPMLAWDPTRPDERDFALGRIMVYEDLNQNARRDPNEPWAGGLGPYALVYASRRLPARVGPARIDVEPGLHMVFAPLPCRPDVPPTSPQCDVPLGAPCHEPSECGAGQCVDRFIVPWPGGFCMVDAKQGCVPAEGALIYGGPGGPYYSLACQTDDDCGRETPYRCDPAQGACMPFNLPRVALGSVPFAPFCGQ